MITTPTHTPETFPHYSEGVADWWTLIEALLINSRSQDERDEVLELCPAHCLDEVMGEWAGDGRYQWLSLSYEALPQSLPAPKPTHDFSHEETILMYRLAYCQSISEGRAIRQALTAINADFENRYWAKLSSDQQARLRQLSE